LSDSQGELTAWNFENFSNAKTAQDSFDLLRNAIDIDDKQELKDLKSRSG
jgi:hypothetical protein